MRIYTLCEPEVWDRAGWFGTAFGHDSKGDDPPFMGLIFRDAAAGCEVFESFRKHTGPTDNANLIRVSIVEGDIPDQDPGYSVVVGLENRKAVAMAKTDAANKSKYVTAMRRVHRMNPDVGSPHLPRFKEEFAKHEQFLFLPVGGTPEALQPHWHLSIEKYTVHFRHVEELTPQDPDHCVLNRPWVAPDFNPTEWLSD